jgi:hypothetical protein
MPRTVSRDVGKFAIQGFLAGVVLSRNEHVARFLGRFVDSIDLTFTSLVSLRKMAPNRTPLSRFRFQKTIARNLNSFFL